MNKRPYTVKMQCPISNIEEKVHFYEIKIEETLYLNFVGCDNGWHKCSECENCKKQAYEKMVIESK